MSDKDTIYRQDAIDAISCNITVTGRQNAELVAATIGSFADRIKALPSADRPIGEWVDNGDRYYRCSLCGTRDTDTWDWCHGCGCRMKGADDEA